VQGVEHDAHAGDVLGRGGDDEERVVLREHVGHDPLERVVAGRDEARQERRAHAGGGRRCEVVGGDFFRHVPEGDLYLLKQVLHDWNDEQCTTILRNCAKSLRAGGRVVIIEMVIPDDLRPSPAALMDLNMLVMLPGRERTRAEYEALFASAGLRLACFHETHSPFQLLEAVRA